MSTQERAMAEAAAAAAPQQEAAAPAGKKTGLIVALTLAGAVAGGLVAAFVVAPRLIRHPAAVAVDSAAAEPAQGEAEAGGGEAAHVPGEKLVQLENIIVNPAGSQGSRFLMTSVAFAVADEKKEKELRERQVELRDRVTGILETMTMAQLTTPGARDTLKSRIAAMAAEMLGEKTAPRVFLPQFVIQ